MALHTLSGLNLHLLQIEASVLRFLGLPPVASVGTLFANILFIHTPSIPEIRQLYDIENIHDIMQQPLGQYKKYRRCCLAKKFNTYLYIKFL